MDAEASRRAAGLEASAAGRVAPEEARFSVWYLTRPFRKT